VKPTPRAEEAVAAAAAVRHPVNGGYYHRHLAVEFDHPWQLNPKKREPWYRVLWFKQHTCLVVWIEVLDQYVLRFIWLLRILFRVI
jgi:hypothetical protein